MNGLAPYPAPTAYDRRRFELLHRWRYCMGDRRWPGADPLARHDSLKCIRCCLERLPQGWERRN